MKKGLLAGTFDPPTWGHIEIIRRGANLVDELVVGIGKHASKNSPLYTFEEKKEGLLEELNQSSSIAIHQISGLLIDFARQNGIDVLIRGLRSHKDLEYEMQMARANFMLGGIETIFLPAGEKTALISSSLIRELASHDAPLSDFIPPYFSKTIHQKISER